MTATNENDDFYEDDEPVEKIRAAFERGEKGVTKRPRDVNRTAASIVEDATGEADVTEPVAVPESANVTFVGARTSTDFMRLEDSPEVTITR